MARVTNLTTARKQARRVERRRKGDETAARFGQSGAQKSLDAARRDKAHRTLDGHRREDRHEE